MDVPPIDMDAVRALDARKIDVLMRCWVDPEDPLEVWGPDGDAVLWPDALGHAAKEFIVLDAEFRERLARVIMDGTRAPFDGEVLSVYQVAADAVIALLRGEE